MVGSPLFLDTFTALGAKTHANELGRCAAHIRQRRGDGQENPIAVYQAAKLHTVAQKHITMWGYVNNPIGVCGEQGHLEQLDTRRPRDREASRH